MKKVFIVNLSEDGVVNAVFTNVQALHNYIMSLSIDGVSGYVPQKVGYDEKKYSYANLNQSLKGKCGCSIYCKNGNIHITKADYITKF